MTLKGPEHLVLNQQNRVGVAGLRDQNRTSFKITLENLIYSAIVVQTINCK
jgi:hypothetical protein